MKPWHYHEISERNNELAQLAYERVVKAMRCCGTIDLRKLERYEADRRRE
jgi:hypothetical protein